MSERERHDIKRAYESFSGWYWIITEVDTCETPDCDCRQAFGLVMGQMIEWGYVDLDEIEGNHPRVWEVDPPSKLDVQRGRFSARNGTLTEEARS